MDQFLNSISSRYKNGIDKSIGFDFIQPCLERCINYKRAVGYFRTSALLMWASSLPRLILEDDLSIQLIASPNLSQTEFDAIRNSIESGQRERVLQQVSLKFFEECFLNNRDNIETKDAQDLLTWLIVKGKLELRLAFPIHIENPGDYHTKIGIFEFENGKKLAFTGSANESLNGGLKNGESIHVFRDWLPGEDERVKEELVDFEYEWTGRSKDTLVQCISLELLNKIKIASPAEPPFVQWDRLTRSKKSSVDLKDPSLPKKWRHQQEALDVFTEKKKGILQMATGTGKTKTSIRILNHLLENSLVNSAIVATKNNDLLEQWKLTLLESSLSKIKSSQIHQYFGSGTKLLRSYTTNPKHKILVCSWNNLHEAFSLLDVADKRKIMVIHDEVHGLGAPKLIENLKGLHKDFEYVLGLSATPDRVYDEDGNDFIQDEVGQVIYEFGLDKAIERGILCEFAYTIIPYELTDEDKSELRNIIRTQSVRESAGNPMTPEEIAQKISRVYKMSPSKTPSFNSFFKDRSDLLKGTIIFVAEKSQGETIYPLLAQLGLSFKGYYAETDTDYLKQFAEKKIDTLIACHKVSQGIDIPHLKNVILVSSDKAKLEAIQRIGRCLRTDPLNLEKKANVIDFVLHNDGNISASNGPDYERANWLTDISKIKFKKEGQDA